MLAACLDQHTECEMDGGAAMTQKRSSRAYEAHLGSGRLFRYQVSKLPTCSASLFRPKARCRTAAVQTGRAVSELCFCPHSNARRTREALDRVPLNEELTLERSDLLWCAGMHCRTL